MKQVLLTRDDFSDGVLARDGHRCVFCGKPAVDAHHIIERRLWPDLGYYLDNGASVCDDNCHMKCEMTLISVEDVRHACGITNIIVPPHLYPDQSYDKWGNPVLPNGQRMRGELFFDESVQKVLRQGGVLDLFTNYVKYPRTHHFSWSQCVRDDDRIIQSVDAFVGQRVIVSCKMDGENTSMYCDYFHARSIDGRSHPSRDCAKNFWSKISHDIPEGWRVTAENLYAEHSIAYDALPSYLMGFGVWNERNELLAWDDMSEWLDLLGIVRVPVLYDGIWDEKAIRKIAENMDFTKNEGIVVRVAGKIGYGEFRHKVAKFVRKDHVQTEKHWMYGQAVVPNKLAVP